nr:MAG TPA: hypothetical protein [Caudoviricetes sp.]
MWHRLGSLSSTIFRVANRCNIRGGGGGLWSVGFLAVGLVWTVGGCRCVSKC